MFQIVSSPRLQPQIAPRMATRWCVWSRKNRGPVVPIVWTVTWAVVTEKRAIIPSFNQRFSLHWRHNEHDGVSNHQRVDDLLNRLFRRRSRKISQLRVAGLCERNSAVTCEFPSQRANNAENVPIWWRHHIESRFIATRLLLNYTMIFFINAILRLTITPVGLTRWIKMSVRCPKVVYDQNVIWVYIYDAIKWKHFPRYWPFVRGIHRSPVKSLHKGQWHGALMFFFFIYAWTNSWANDGDAGELRRHLVYYDVIVMCVRNRCIEG